MKQYSLSLEQSVRNSDNLRASEFISPRWNKH